MELPNKALPAVNIVRKLREAGHAAFLAGGCVRDLLLGRPAADYDVTTSATPQEVMRLFPRTYGVGAHFGVVLVPVRGNVAEGGRPQQASEERSVKEQASEERAIEVATFRSDGSYSDGRHPDQVCFSTDARTDTRRRDFTINGMLFDPVSHEVLDYVHGMEDLKLQTIRAIGDPGRRFAEDKLRMLRAVRFAARLNYRVEDETMAAIRERAREIHQVSRERIRDELLKMLTEGRARQAFELLDRATLLEQVLPEIKRMQGVEQPPQFHPEGDVWIHTLMLLEGLPPNCSKTLALGALLHDVGKPPTFRAAPDRIRFDNHAEVGATMAAGICARLRLSNEEADQVRGLVANHMRFGDVKRMKDSTLKRFLRLPAFEEHLELHRLDCLGSHRDLELYDFSRDKLQNLSAEQIRPRPLINGNDLIQAGYQPGPGFKEMLAMVEDAQLEGSISTREEALALVRARVPVVGEHGRAPR